jgi:hypothetical protein
MPRADHGAEPVLGGGEDAAHQHVADFGGGQVDPPAPCRCRPAFHRLPADAGGVEHQAVIVALQPRRDLLHAGRGDAEHGQADGRLARRGAVRRAAPCTMPAMACAALPSTSSVIALSPCTSATECIIVMSDGPTYLLHLAEATVETISLGTPTGSARIAGATMAVPPEPPADMMPAMPSCRAIQRSKASVMPATEWPRSPVNTPAAPRG